MASSALLANLRVLAGEAITVPYRGTTPFRPFVLEFIAESAIHTWDLATALGVAVAFPEQAVRTAHDGLTLMLRESFAPVAFRDPQSASQAHDFEGLLRRSGR